jgi:hypothetical protein
MRYGIYEYASAGAEHTGNRYIGNAIRGWLSDSTRIIWVDTQLIGNSAPLNERWGVDNMSDGQQITHGLSITPTWVNVNGSVADEIVTATAIDATHITVAIKKRTDGSSGTTQNVYWLVKRWNNTADA